MKRQASEEIRKELRESAPFLSGLEHGNAFEVPEAYFEGLEERILSATTGTGRVFRISTRKVLAWAASLLLLVTFTWAAYRFVVVPILRQKADQEAPVKHGQETNTPRQDEITGVPDVVEGHESGIVQAEGGAPSFDNPVAGHAGPSQEYGQASDHSGLEAAGAGTGGNPVVQTPAVTHADNPDTRHWSDTTLCLGTSIVYRSIDGGATYNWKIDGRPVPTERNQAMLRFETAKAGSGVHILDLAVQDKTGRVISTEHISILVLPPLQFDLGTDRCVEAGYRLAVDSEKSFEYLWSDGSRTAVITPAKSGAYWLRVSRKDLPACTSSDTVRLTVISEPKDQFQPALSYCNDKDLRLSVPEPVEGYDYSWEPSYTQGKTLFLGNNSPGSYTYTLVSTICGVSYREDVIVNIEDCNLHIPNVITPNSDNVNDRFEIENIESFPGSRLVIMDRTGQKVFEDNNYQNTWDGRGCPDGTYYYILLLNGPTHSEFSGTITIIR